MLSRDLREFVQSLNDNEVRYLVISGYGPAFWDWLVAGNSAGRVLSIERVGDEIEAGADELAAWAVAWVYAILEVTGTFTQKTPRKGLKQDDGGPGGARQTTACS